MTYQVKLASRVEREARIKMGLASPVGTFDSYDFRNTYSKLPIVQLEIDLPIYRMENYRTFTDQREYIAKEGLKGDYFLLGQEMETAQQIQHDLLAALARKGVSDSMPLIDVLKKEKQQDPILITSYGVVVNGNRRLAAMRELLSSEPSFSHIRCAVLPEDATAEDIVNLEAALQAKPETKLDYDWIGDAQLVSRLVSLHHGSIPEVAKRLNRSDKEIKNSILALAEADLYLKEWAHAEGAYSKVKEDAEQLFKDMPKQLEGKDPAMKKASRAVAWTLFEQKDKLPGRVYNFNPAFGKLAAEVLDKVASDLGIPTETKNESDEGGFAVDIGDEPSAVSYEGVIDALRRAKDDESIAESLIEAAQNAVEIDKGQKSGQAALKAVQQAHAKLMSVDAQRAAPETRGAMRKQLEAISQLTSLLMKKLDAFKDGSGS